MVRATKGRDGTVSDKQHHTWHELHTRSLSLGERIADKTALTIGSWPFIIGQTIAVAVWVTLNLTAVVRKWDPYPFILLNLMFSVQAAYAAPIIMMSQNRQAERDRIQAQEDLDTNVKAELEVEDVQAHLATIEEALGRVERMLERVTRPQQAEEHRDPNEA